MELTIDIAVRGNNFAKNLLSKRELQRQQVYDFFNDKNEAIFVCNFLSDKGHIKLLAPSDAEPFGVVEKKDSLEYFINNGGLVKIATDLEKQKAKALEREIKEDKILDLDLKLKSFEAKIGNKIIVAGFIILILSFLISILTVEFWHDCDKHKNKEPQEQTQ